MTAPDDADRANHDRDPAADRELGIEDGGVNDHFGNALEAVEDDPATDTRPAEDADS